MALLAISEQDAELSARGGALVILVRGLPVRSIPAHEVTEVQLYGRADLTASGRNFLLARGIDVAFFTLDGRYRGRLLGQESLWGERRLAQYRLLSDRRQRVQLAGQMIAGKLLNQYQILLNRQRSLQDEALADVLALLRGLAGRVREEEADLDRLRGLEGVAAARYFGVFDKLLLNSGFRWNGRNRRPPRDPINACLSFGYTLLVSRTDAALRATGLDPALGLLHESIRGRPSLALDLAEEFRPMVDNLVLTLINRRQLGPEDFSPAPEGKDVDEEGEIQEGAVYLGEVGRKILLRAWALRLSERSPHPTRDEEWTIEGLIRAQAQALRGSFEEGKPYTPARLT